MRGGSEVGVGGGEGVEDGGRGVEDGREKNKATLLKTIMRHHMCQMTTERVASMVNHCLYIHMCNV